MSLVLLKYYLMVLKRYERNNCNYFVLIHKSRQLCYSFESRIQTFKFGYRRTIILKNYLKKLIPSFVDIIVTLHIILFRSFLIIILYHSLHTQVNT